MFGPDSGWASFPSGHTTRIMSCAMALALIFPRLRVPILILGVIVSFGRIAVGAHYPSDVLGGIALGALVSWLFARALAQRRVVFRFDEQGRVKPLHYVGKSFIPRGARSSRARS
jgi:undecaprenyl-diphosphatase